MAKGNRFDMSSFYCPRCGKKAMDLPRPRSLTRQAFHRKKLYCIYCKTEVNHIEIKNHFDAEKFKEEFERGVYIDEAKESLVACGHSRLW